MRKLLMALGSVVVLAGGAQAQTNVESRVGRLESEMRAVQRKVFPGGAVQPDITAPTTPTAIPGAPAASAVADLSQRLSSVESQMSTLTGQIEQAQFSARQLQEAFDAYRRTTDARLKALEAGPAPIAGAGASAPLDTPAPRPTRPVTADEEDTPTPSPAVAVARPSTGDAAEDGYTYGYRLWQARRFADAQTQLKKVVAEHPRHRRASYAQNLLGRAYLDDGKPSLASMAFYDNYKKMPDGERAADSLLYLGQSLVKLNKAADACKVYSELGDVYGGKLSASMQAQLTRSRADAKCK